MERVAYIMHDGFPLSINGQARGYLTYVYDTGGFTALCGTYSVKQYWDLHRTLGLSLTQGEFEDNRRLHPVKQKPRMVPAVKFFENETFLLLQFLLHVLTERPVWFCAGQRIDDPARLDVFEQEYNRFIADRFLLAVDPTSAKQRFHDLLYKHDPTTGALCVYSYDQLRAVFDHWWAV